MMVGIKEQDADVEVALPVQGKLSSESGRIKKSVLKGGHFLSVVYHGSYIGLRDAWAEVNRYIIENGIEVKIPGRELYLNDPACVPEDELMTEIQIQLISMPEK